MSTIVKDVASIVRENNRLTKLVSKLQRAAAPRVAKPAAKAAPVKAAAKAVKPAAKAAPVKAAAKNAGKPAVKKAPVKAGKPAGRVAKKAKDEDFLV